MTATLIGPDGSQPARVNELTASGARIGYGRSVRPGTDVIFKRGDTFAAARVVWSDEQGAGLEFYRPLEELQIAA
jgi:hypothetical protein